MEYDALLSIFDRVAVANRVLAQRFRAARWPQNSESIWHAALRGVGGCTARSVVADSSGVRTACWGSGGKT